MKAAEAIESLLQYVETTERNRAPGEAPWARTRQVIRLLAAWAFKRVGDRTACDFYAHPMLHELMMTNHVDGFVACRFAECLALEAGAEDPLEPYRRAVPFNAADELHLARLLTSSQVLSPWVVFEQGGNGFATVTRHIAAPTALVDWVGVVNDPTLNTDARLHLIRIGLRSFAPQGLEKTLVAIEATKAWWPSQTDQFLANDFWCITAIGFFDAMVFAIAESVNPLFRAPRHSGPEPAQIPSQLSRARPAPTPGFELRKSMTAEQAIETLVQFTEKTERKRSPIEAPLPRTQQIIQLEAAWALKRVGANEASEAHATSVLAALRTSHEVDQVVARCFTARLAADAPSERAIVEQSHSHLAVYARFRLLRLMRASQVLCPYFTFEPFDWFKRASTSTADPRLELAVRPTMALSEIDTDWLELIDSPSLLLFRRLTLARSGLACTAPRGLAATLVAAESVRQLWTRVTDQFTTNEYWCISPIELVDAIVFAIAESVNPLPPPPDEFDLS